MRPSVQNNPYSPSNNPQLRTNICDRAHSDPELRRNYGHLAVDEDHQRQWFDGETMTPAVENNETQIKSYRYLRVAMVGLLLFLGLAVIDQTWDQGWQILSSISAYYYTSAQAVFVGALIAVGVCMIALQGTTPAEDILLNIGGMLAPVVALVPTALDADTLSAIRACRQSLGSVYADQGMPIDCLDLKAVDALEAATRPNIENNVPALIVTGAVALVATFVFHRLSNDKIENFGRNFVVAVVIYGIGVLLYLTWRDGFIKYAHYAAAFSLFACIVAVAIVNALRQEDAVRNVASTRVRRVLGVVVRHAYAIVAVAMVLAALIGLPLAVWGPGSVTLFWLEAVLIALFAAFWIIQTAEQWNEDPLILPVQRAGDR